MEDTATLAAVRREDLLNRILHAVSAQQAWYPPASWRLWTRAMAFCARFSYLPATGDVYISQSQIRRFGLRTGDTVTGQVRPPKEGERYFGLVRVEQVNGVETDQLHIRFRPQFEYLTPIFPELTSCWKRTAPTFPPGWLTCSLPSGWGSGA